MAGPDTLRLALIGAGVIGARHLQSVAAEPCCRLVALADPAPAARAVAEAAGVLNYTDYEEMLDRERPQGAIVAAPTPLHAPIGEACARRGIHMLMEKPVTDTVDAGHGLIAAAEQHGVRILAGHYRRFDPAVEAAGEIIASGEIGRLIAISGQWAVRKPDHYYDMDWRCRAGGGPILINLIHDIDMMRLWCGEVESVYADTGNTERGFVVEDSGAFLLRFQSGVRATITFSDATPSPWGWERASGDNPHTPASGENCYRLFGTAASFEFPNIAVWRTPDGAAASWEQPISKEARPLPERAALAAQLRHFCEVVRGEVEPRVSAVDALARLGRPVEPGFRLGAAG